ncbi:MAG TPA: MerR family transcriptional regulator [Ktedonobacterales bacterium]|nr:MerR family transcriptional regulator [Ktedonobacterales bacterium]
MRQKRSPAERSFDNPHLPKYSIAVVADLSGVPQQQLRRMEEGGLIAPERSKGNTRRYSDNDLRQIAEVAELADTGINQFGIQRVLAMRDEARVLRAEIEALRLENAELREQVELQRRKQGKSTMSRTKTSSKSHT